MVHEEPEGMRSRILRGLPRGPRELAAPAIAACPQLTIPAGRRCHSHQVTTSPLLVVEEGVVLVMTAQKRAPRRSVLAMASQDALLPPPSVDEELVALEDARLTVLTPIAERALLARPEGARMLADSLVDALRESREDLAIFGHVSHKERVRHKLRQLARSHGHVLGRERVLLELRLTHGVIAGMVGSARETVSSALGELTDEGFISRAGRHYLVAVPPEEL
jgi:CRP-like cAMP-binding protein